MAIRGIAAGALLAAFAAVNVMSYNAGKRAAERQADAATAKISERLAEAEARSDAEEVKRLHAERERDELARRLDAEAAIDPRASDAGLSHDSLLRLDTIR